MSTTIIRSLVLARATRAADRRIAVLQALLTQILKHFVTLDSRLILPRRVTQFIFHYPLLNTLYIVDARIA